MTHFLPMVLLASSLSTYAQDEPRAIILDAPPTSNSTPSYHRVSSNGVTLHLVRFDSRDYQLTVVDQKNGPASEWLDSGSLGKSKNALAAINGGFFTPEGKPLGMVIASNFKRGANNPSSLGSGFYFSNNTHTGIARRAAMREVIEKVQPSQLLQTGSMLTYRGETVSGLSNERSRPRSFIAYDGGTKWLIGYAEMATLAQLGNALTGKTLADTSIYHAINLDGGRSSDFWISDAVENGNKTFRAFWNKPVRNFLLLERK